METKYRLLAVFLLIGTTFGMCIYYAGAGVGEYPDGSEIVESPGAYDGEEVLLFPDVVSVSPEENEMVAVIEKEKIKTVGLGGVKRSQMSHRFTVRVSDSSIEGLKEGSEVQVFGTLSDGGTVLTSKKEVLIEFRDSTDWQYAILISVLGAVLVMGYFLRRWGIDARKVGFVSRRETTQKTKDEKRSERDG